jgi:hypothetical protein
MLGELIADGRANKIRSVRVKTVGDDEIDLTQVDEPEIDRYFLTIGAARLSTVTIPS